MVVLREVLAIHRLGEHRTKTVRSVWEDDDHLHGDIGVWADLPASLPALLQSVHTVAKMIFLKSQM